MPYTIFEHIADVGILVHGNSEEELFSDALCGMMKILDPRAIDPKQKVERTVTLDAPDTTALLIDFLNNVLSNAYINKEMYTEVVFKKLSEHSLGAVLRGFAARDFGEDIKAVTYHGADVKQNEKGIWETKILFDI